MKDTAFVNLFQKKEQTIKNKCYEKILIAARDIFISRCHLFL